MARIVNGLIEDNRVFNEDDNLERFAELQGYVKSKKLEHVFAWFFVNFRH